MGQQVRKRSQGSISYQKNSVSTLSLSRGMVYREIYINLTGQPTLLAANNTAAKTLWGDEWSIVKRIELVANNTDVLRSFSGNSLWWINFTKMGMTPPTTALMADGATANVSFDSTLVLPLWMPRCIRPMDTALDARVLSDLKLRITWGDSTDLNADAAAWTTDPQINVHSYESFNVQGPFSQWRSYEIEKEITATNPQFQVSLPVGPMYRGFLLNFTDAGKDDGDILNNLKILSGTTVFADVPERILEQAEALRTQNVYQNARKGTTYNSADGWYYYDHIGDGYLSEAIDTLGFSEMTLEMDVTVGAGTTKVLVIPDQIYPVRKK